MAALIKSTSVTGEPVVLARAVKADEPADPPVAQGESTIDRLEPLMELASDNVPEEAAPPDFTDYEEYKARFEAELRTVEEEARQRGLDRGYAEGVEQAKAECQAQLDAAVNLVAAMREALDRSIDGLADVGIEIVCEAAAKVIGEALVERAAAIAIVRQVIRQAKDRSKLLVRVAPPDRQMLQAHMADIVDGLSVGNLEIVADDRVQAGGCLLETAAGNLDGRLEIQLERLRDALLGARNAERETGVAA